MAIRITDAYKPGYNRVNLDLIGKSGPPESTRKVGSPILNQAQADVLRMKSTAVPPPDTFFIAMTDYGYAQGFQHSADGLTWAPCTFDTPSADRWACVRYGGGLWVALDRAGHIFTSEDGVAWLHNASGSLAVSYYEEDDALVYDPAGARWLRVGPSAGIDSTVYAAADPRGAWTRIDNGSITYAAVGFLTGLAVLPDNSILAFGQNGVARSTSGGYGFTKLSGLSSRWGSQCRIPSGVSIVGEGTNTAFAAPSNYGSWTTSGTVFLPRTFPFSARYPARAVSKETEDLIVVGAGTWLGVGNDYTHRVTLASALNSSEACNLTADFPIKVNTCGAGRGAWGEDGRLVYGGPGGRIYTWTGLPSRATLLSSGTSDLPRALNTITGWTTQDVLVFSKLTR